VITGGMGFFASPAALPSSLNRKVTGPAVCCTICVAEARAFASAKPVTFGHQWLAKKYSHAWLVMLPSALPLGVPTM
jgi:hypothetical protein